MTGRNPAEPTYSVIVATLDGRHLASDVCLSRGEALRFLCEVNTLIDQRQIGLRVSVLPETGTRH